MKNFFGLIGTLFREDDGKSLSHRKVIAFIFVAYIFFMIYATYKAGITDLYSDVVWISMVGGALGISYIRQMINLKAPKQ